MKELPVTIHLDHVTFQLKEHQDFEWLTKLGKVFAVFDKQDSGNLSFGIEQDGLNRSFAKWEAGKPLYDVAYRAVESDRNKRYTSVKAFYEAWCSVW
ncbi:hypothetical protein CG478_004595 [Bacillus cytotoxicus]|nr:hypothetical protein CG483_010660 [Bacillus cytotoxicus]AWC39840.1 hypothetical protein CG480_004595 [Bacillus cytotoxicus]AWC47771.1 hypothetical protein CG478_004595 [Bacillus cytotoxicus]AWC52844.1 hypothetical protein CG477_010615 [Bacillus cytotoxicus]AWC56976.1 hypothetical protein CG476_010645 [Bacillus cytotoxicus]